MPIDFSYLEGAAPQEESTPVMSDTANVTIRVDADSMLLCDGEYIDQVFKAGVLTKIQMCPGQHLLEFLYTEDPDIKIEKEVDFPESGKSYLVLIKGLKELVDAAEAEDKQKAEEEARKKAEEEAKRIAEEEAKRKAEEEAEAKRKARAEAEAKNGALNGHDYVDLGLPSGLKWATCNIGANSPEEYGDYYAWGELKTKSSYTKENSITDGKSIIDIFGDPTYDVARAKWGSSWRMPTLDEIKELIYGECKWEWEDKGYVVTGPNGNRIFLPVGGYCKECASCDGDEGYIWSSTPVKGDCSSAYGMHFAHTFGFLHRIEKNLVRSYGLSVRPVLGQEAEEEAKRKHLAENERNNLCDLVLLHASAFGMLRVLRVLRETIGISVSGSDLVNTPYVIKRSISKSEAEAFKRQLEEAGAEVEIR